MTRVPERRGGDWARVPRIRDRRAGRVRPRSGPRARCGRGFALKYASRRRRGFPRGAPRRQGTGPCRSTRQNCVRSWSESGRSDEGERGEMSVWFGTRRSTVIPSATGARPARARRDRNEVGMVPMVEANGSKPISPLSVAAEPHCVSIKELQLGRRAFNQSRLKIRSVPRTAKCSPAGGLEGPVYIVQNELSITDSGSFGPPDPGPRAGKSSLENLAATPQQFRHARRQSPALGLAPHQPVHRRPPGALSHALARPTLPSGVPRSPRGPGRRFRPAGRRTTPR